MGSKITRSTAAFDERLVLAEFQRDRLSHSRWSSGPGEVYSSHSHAYHKVLYCVRGSVTFQFDISGESHELQAGDRLDIEPGTFHSAVVGPRGVECIEAPGQ
jgi:quercetin dioxygenase-like cupin family protein